MMVTAEALNGRNICIFARLSPLPTGRMSRQIATFSLDESIIYSGFDDDDAR